MHKKGLKIDLIKVENNTPRAFDIEHAENILKDQKAMNKNNWILPKNSKYTFTDGKLIPTPDSGNIKKSEESTEDSISD